MGTKCNDCGGGSKTPMVIRGVSDLAGGDYYNGPEICEQCAIKRRESAIVMYNLRIGIEDHIYDEC